MSFAGIEKLRPAVLHTGEFVISKAQAAEIRKRWHEQYGGAAGAHVAVLEAAPRYRSTCAQCGAPGLGSICGYCLTPLQLQEAALPEMADERFRK